jgi:hypothetical protein
LRSSWTRCRVDKCRCLGSNLQCNQCSKSCWCSSHMEP